MSNWKDLAVEVPPNDEPVLFRHVKSSDAPSLVYVYSSVEGIRILDWWQDGHEGFEEILAEGLIEGVFRWCKIPEDK